MKSKILIILCYTEARDEDGVRYKTKTKEEQKDLFSYSPLLTAGRFLKGLLNEYVIPFARCAHGGGRQDTTPQ